MQSFRGRRGSKVLLLLNLLLLSPSRAARALSPDDVAVLADGDVIEEADLDLDGRCISVPAGSTVTINGRHDFLRVEIAASAVVTHAAGSFIRWRVEEEVVVLGAINVSRKGLPGANRERAGAPARAAGPASTCDDLAAGAGAGDLAGGSHGGLGGACASRACSAGAPNATYGSLEAPCLPGSGGGACAGGEGGNGGGAVWIEAQAARVNGLIVADGEGAPSRRNGGGGGSGGSIYLCVDRLGGSGWIRADGGSGSSFGGGGGGGGRIALAVREEITFSEEHVLASGGLAGRDCPVGQVGTIWIRVGDRNPTVILGPCRGEGSEAAPMVEAAAATGRLVVRGPVRLRAAQVASLAPERIEAVCGGAIVVDERLRIDEKQTLHVDGGSIVVEEQGTLDVAVLDGAVVRNGLVRVAGAMEVRGGTAVIGAGMTVETVGKGVKLRGAGGAVLSGLTVEPGGVLTHAAGPGNELRLEVAGDLNVLGSIDATGKGLAGADTGLLASRDAEAVSAASQCGAVVVVEGPGSNAGGSHGGRGGRCTNGRCPAATTNPLYGDPEAPCLPGSGGGACSGGRGGNGGGVVWIEADRLRVEGAVAADGGSPGNNSGASAGGSGGSICVRVRSVIGGGTISARGGTGEGFYGGSGGGGGRVAILFTTENGVPSANISAEGGGATRDCPGGLPGTVSIRLQGAAADFHRGDPSGDGASNLTDAVAVLNYLFEGAEAPSCLESADVDDEGRINIADAVFLLNFLFLQGPPPAPPGPPTGGHCGPDPTSSPHIGCSAYAGC